jgi:hypothetical protein
MSRVRSCSAVDNSPAMHALQVVMLMAKIYDKRHAQIVRISISDGMTLNQKLQLEPTADSEARSAWTRRNAGSCIGLSAG